MAKQCICCDKQITFFSGSNYLSHEFNEVICDSCYAKFGVKLNILKNTATFDDIAEKTTEAQKAVDEAGFLPKGKEYVLSFIESCSQEIYNKLKLLEEEQQKIQQTILDDSQRQIKQQELIRNHLVTMGYNFEGYKIKKYISVLSGSVVLGTGFLSEIGANISDLLGTRSTLFSDKLEEAREYALNNLILKSAEKDGNAIIGVNFDYITFSGNMIGVIANGTAVEIEKISSNTKE